MPRGEPTQRTSDDPLPPIDRRVWWMFGRYVRWYLRRHFHEVLWNGADPHSLDHTPLLIYTNHPSWWDPLIGLTLAQQFWDDRQHRAPIDAAMLERYGFFRRLGFFGVPREESCGAAAFLRAGRAALEKERGVLWISAQGRFVDPREGAAYLKPGIAHLARRMTRGHVLPIAMEYPFWDERLPQVLVRIGEPINVVDMAGTDVAGWRDLLRDHLAVTQEQLAEDAISRDAERFHTLLSGQAGVGIAYDAWRWMRAKWRGQAYHPEHGRSTT